MAQRIVVEMTDDLGGGKADQTVQFSLDGRSYEIDLSKKNTAALTKALTTYLADARPARRTGASVEAGRGRRSDVSVIRQWLRNNGHTIRDKGRIPADLLAEYQAAN